jgi:hypothetical protein
VPSTVPGSNSPKTPTPGGTTQPSTINPNRSPGTRPNGLPCGTLPGTAGTTPKGAYPNSGSSTSGSTPSTPGTSGSSTEPRTSPPSNPCPLATPTSTKPPK